MKKIPFIYRHKEGVVVLFDMGQWVRVGEYDTADQAYRAWDVYCSKDTLPTGYDATEADNLAIFLWSRSHGKNSS